MPRLPSRITARTYVGRSGILNIEREAQLSGQIHSKASLILVGLIGGLYARKSRSPFPRPFASSRCTAGWTATAPPAPNSSPPKLPLDIPLKQGICVTGSLNQKGEVQPIGGVNEKIEGVYRIMKAKGLTGQQGVIIPVQNIVNLMLDEEVVAAVAAGKFHVWAIRTVNEGLELLTDRPARVIHAAVRKTLERYQERPG